MDFQQLLAKMNELSQPAPANTAVVEEPVVAQECGEMPPAPMGMDQHSDTPPPSISVNLNAQGLDNIEQLLDLIKAVNPDAAPAAPTMGAAPGIEIEPMDKPESPFGNLDSGPLKMLPEPDELDGEEDGEEDKDDTEGLGGALAGGAIGAVAGGPLGALTGAAAGDSLTDPDADEAEQDQEEEESFGNSVGDSEPETMGMDSVIRNGNDLNREKKQFRRAQPGDNPMAMEGEELRAWIKSELTQRLAEAKGAK